MVNAWSYQRLRADGNANRHFEVHVPAGGVISIDTGVLAYPSVSYPGMGRFCIALRRYNDGLKLIIHMSSIIILEDFCLRNVLLHSGLDKLPLHLDAGTCIITGFDI